MLEDMEEDQQALINLERNIANLERSMSASQLERGDMNSLLGRQVSKVTNASLSDMTTILFQQVGSLHSLNTTSSTATPKTRYSTAQEIVKKR